MIYTPSRINATRLRLIKSRLLTPRIKPHNQRTYPKRPHTPTLRISLLYTRNIFRDILHRHRILHREAMTLRFETSAVDEYAGIGVEAGEGEADVFVDEGDFGGCDTGVLEFHGGSLFAAEDDDAAAFDGDGAGAAFYCFEGVFDLEDVAVGGEDYNIR